MPHDHWLRAAPVHTALLAAPLIFIAHVAEEAPGFVAWVNGHIDRGITQSDFWTGNSIGLGITLLVVLFEWVRRSKASAAVALAWLGFVMLGNAVLHTGGAIIYGEYAPGVITALALYVPYSLWIIARVLGTRRLSATAASVALIIGSLPMLAHGYMIVFRGTRLFQVPMQILDLEEQFYRWLGYVVSGVMPDANGRGKPDIYMSKPLGEK